MTESDVLARAARALREAHTGEREGSGFTRARIMNTLHRERRRRTLRWAIFSPIASVLLVGSAWAESSGKWPVIWKTVASVFVSAPLPEPGVPPVSRRSSPHEEAAPAREEQPPPTPAVAADAGAAEAEAPMLEAPKPEPRARRQVRRRLREAPTAPAPRSLEPEPSTPARDEPAVGEPERDRELGRFRRAHDLHFKGRASEAIDAYSEYLREYPSGRFVPEARYAMALDEIKRGNDAAAREALAPFAAGRYGGYRQKEARTLLEALEKKLERKKPDGR